MGTVHNQYDGITFDIIRRYSSEKDPYTQKQIVDKIENLTNEKCDRKKIDRVLKRLRNEYGRDEDGEWINDEVHLHYACYERNKQPYYTKYWMETFYEDEFSEEELMFLIDAVQFSKHVTNNYAGQLINKLNKQSSNSFEWRFENYRANSYEYRSLNYDFFRVIGDVNEAIRLGKMISFFVDEYGVDKKLHHVVDSPIEASPYRIVVSEGNYYLLYSEKRSPVIKSTRIDRISDVCILEEDSMEDKYSKQVKHHPEEYLAEHLYMDSGRAVDVALKIDKRILGDAIDCFGRSIRIDSATENRDRLIIHAKASEKGVIDWSLRYGENSVLLAPEYLRNEIRDRLNMISRSYDDYSSNIAYLEIIKRAEDNGRLWLRNIDLSGQESYKDLKGITAAYFTHNGIKDFSFLSSYTDLGVLEIRDNTIMDPDVISDLKNLKILGLSNTGITDLDFLSGKNHIRRLLLREFCLENVEGLYTMPHLRSLTVNKPIDRLIDKRRIKEVYGDSLSYRVEDYKGISRIMRTNYLPPKVNRNLSNNTDELSKFSTLEVNSISVRRKLCSMIYTGVEAAQRHCAEKVFSLLDEACDSEERLRMYEDIGSYAGEEFSWYVTYEGAPNADIAQMDIEDIYTISIFKNDHGLKMVCIAHRILKNFFINESDFMSCRNKWLYAFPAHIRFILDNGIGWAEVSGELEDRFSQWSTLSDIVNPQELVKSGVFGNVEVDVDEYHYCRENEDHTWVRKIVYGDFRDE